MVSLKKSKIARQFSCDNFFLKIFLSYECRLLKQSHKVLILRMNLTVGAAPGSAFGKSNVSKL